MRAGDAVRRGQPLGRSGNVGASTAPHLHVEVSTANPDATDHTYPITFAIAAGVTQPVTEGSTYAGWEPGLAP